jgi:hypothetical protein
MLWCLQHGVNLLMCAVYAARALIKLRFQFGNAGVTYCGLAMQVRDEAFQVCDTTQTAFDLELLFVHKIPFGETKIPLFALSGG